MCHSVQAVPARMTSLAQQLQRLAVPHTRTVLATDKRRASLLFDPKEAANLDRETVYALGRLGEGCMGS